MTVVPIQFRCRHCDEVVDVVVENGHTVRLTEDYHDCNVEGHIVGHFIKPGFRFSGCKDENYEIEVATAQAALDAWGEA